MQGFADLPVCVDLPGRLGQEVAAYVEAEAGWQIVSGDGPLLPVFTLAGPGPGPEPHAGAGAGRRVIVVPAPADPAAVREALLAGASDVIGWPDERERLLQLPARVAPVRADSAARTRMLRVGGCRGGVGTSTVALATGATVAWSGRRSLVVGDNAMLRLAGVTGWTGPGSAELIGLGEHAASEVERLACPVPGVDGLSLLGGGALLPEVAGWPYDLVVVDVGVAGIAQAGLVVAAADASVAVAPASAAVVVVEHGPLDRGAVARCLGRTPNGWLPYSNRVARAGSAGRVPAALPGSWVRALRQALAGAVA